MEPGGGTRWAERLRALQLPDYNARGGGATGLISALLMGGKEGDDETMPQAAASPSVILISSVKIRATLSKSAFKPEEDSTSLIQRTQHEAFSSK